MRLRLDHARAEFQDAQASVAQTAAAAFEDTGSTSMAGVLTSGDPSMALRQGSLLMELSGNRTAQTRQLLADASQLAGAEQEMSADAGRDRGPEGRARSDRRKSSLGKLIDTPRRPRWPSLSRDAAAGGPGRLDRGGRRGHGHRHSAASTSTQAGKAVAFAYAQLGKPYQWGATERGQRRLLRPGPGRLGGGRGRRSRATTYAAVGPRCRTSPPRRVQPGDLLYYDGEGHVAMYVGGGYIIDAPQTGMDIQKIPQNNSWYASNFDGAVRP